MRVSLVIGIVLAGCASAPQPRAAVDVEGAIASWSIESAGSRATVLRRERPMAPVRIGEIRVRRPRGRALDARFQDAPLASALTLLADAARMNVVIGEGVSGTVSADLRGVRPLDAMEALAEAHGVELSIVGRTVIARGR